MNHKDVKSLVRIWEILFHLSETMWDFFLLVDLVISPKTLNEIYTIKVLQCGNWKEAIIIQSNNNTT